jgi:regulator of protease activity HflC (stomatin/prohibitin superfamily)
MKRATIAIAALLAFVLTGCATASTGPDLMAVHYEGGAVSEKKFKDCLDPSSRSGFDPGDEFYAYPTRQVSYDATGGDDAERGRFKVVSKDNAELFVPVTVTFRLKTDCKTLRKFHETVGARNAAYFDANGNSSEYPDGWVKLLNYVIGKPLDTTLDRVAQDYNWREVWNNPDVKVELEKAVNDGIDEMVARQAGGEFFEDFSVLVMKPDPVAEGLKAAIADEQTKVAQAQAAQAQAKADQAKAEAQVAVARAEAAKKQAEIRGFGGIDAYLRALCIEKGCGNPWQPTYLFGGTAPR